MLSLQTELKVEMVRKEYDIGTLAKDAGMSRQTLSKKLNGHVEFTYGEIGQLARALNVPLSELIRRAEQNRGETQ